MASPNQEVGGLSPEAEVAALKKYMTSLLDTNKSLSELVQEGNGNMILMLNDIKALKKSEESLKASQENISKEEQKLQSEISNLNYRMRNQYENHKDLERKWNSEKEKLESQKRNLTKEFDMANKRVVSSKERIRELSTKLQLLESKVSETKMEFMSRLEFNEKKLHLLNETYEISVDDFESLEERVARVESIVDQGVIDQMKATIKSLERKLDEQRRLNLSVDVKGEILFELQQENEKLQGHVSLLEDLLKNMI